MEGSSYALKKLSPHRAGNRYLTEKLVNKAHANTSPLPHLPAQMLSPMEHMNPTLTQQHHVWGLGEACRPWAEIAQNCSSAVRAKHGGMEEMIVEHSKPAAVTASQQSCSSSSPKLAQINTANIWSS